MSDNRLDACLTLLADKHRRRVLQRLRDEPGETTVEELVDALHAEGSITADEKSPREDLTIALVHNHLPKLAEHDVVEYDPERKTVRYQSDDQVETVLDALRKDVPLALN